LTERAFRRALGIAPFETRVLENWKLLRDLFPEKQNLFHPVARIELVNTNTGKNICTFVIFTNITAYILML